MLVKLEEIIFEKYEDVRIAAGVFFAQLPINPNTWTVLAILAAIGGAAAIATMNIFVGLFAFLLSVIFDIIDGGVARVRKGETPFGAWFDAASDRARELLLFFSIALAPLAWVGPFITKDIAILALAVLTVFIPLLKMDAFYRKILKEGDVAKFARLERIERFAIVFVGLALYHFNASVLAYTVFAALALSILRIVQTVHFVVEKEKERFGPVKKVWEVTR